MTVGTVDVTWIRHLLEELNKLISSSMLLCDNQSAINIAFNPILHCHTKHIEVGQHFDIKWKKKRQNLDMFGCPSTCQFWSFKDKLCMIENHAQLEGGY